MSRKSYRATHLKIIGAVFLAVLLVFSLWTYDEITKLKKSTKSGWFHPPTEVYTSALTIKKGQKIDAQTLSELLKKMKFDERGLNQSLGDNEFTFLPDSNCADSFEIELNPQTRTCFYIRLSESKTYLMELSYQKVTEIYDFQYGMSEATDRAVFKPLLFSQTLNKKPIKRTFKPLSHIPRYCIDAVLATEDDRFLNHNGVSLRGILRAAIANIKSGRFSQGGSTLTQQLVKNKYLTAEKTLSRKAQEAWIALLLELVLEKDEILESYLNYIYWGRTGSYSIHGIEEASKLYFDKSVEKLGLSECSLLAGAIKGPGIYGPHRKASQKRQEIVLTRMLELGLIGMTEKKRAQEKEIYVAETKGLKAPKAPYFIDAVFKKLKETKIKDLSGLEIYTTMDYFVQNTLEDTLDEYLKQHPNDFYGSLLIGDPSTKEVKALSSGVSDSRNFNSAIEAKRQVGSLAKPFVYLTAFQELEDLTPLTDISNNTFTYKYEGQTWSPKNYSKDQTRSYSVYESLSMSKNRPTVRLMSKFGYKKVYKTLLDFGFEDFTPVTPSLALGSFESSPLSVLKAFMNFSDYKHRPTDDTPQLIAKVLDGEKNLIYEKEKRGIWGENEKELEPNPYRESQRMVLEMLKNTLTIGTAKRSLYYNLEGVYAGKTGTTNDHNDGWFAALSPDLTYVTWVGEDKKLKDKGVKLTGSSAALPLWLKLVQKIESQGLTDLKKDWESGDLEKLVLPSGKEKDIKLLMKQQ